MRVQGRVKFSLDEIRVMSVISWLSPIVSTLSTNDEVINAGNDARASLEEDRE